jgi:hypothetical protein
VPHFSGVARYFPANLLDIARVRALYCPQRAHDVAASNRSRCVLAEYETVRRPVIFAAAARVFAAAVLHISAVSLVASFHNSQNSTACHSPLPAHLSRPPYRASKTGGS